MSDTTGPPAPADDGSQACAATDLQHDWVQDALGVDPRSYDAGAAPPPHDNRPDADGDGPSGPPPAPADTAAAAGQTASGTANVAGQSGWDSVKDLLGIGPAADRKAVVDKAVAQVSTRTDEQIQAMSALDKAKLVQDITSNGEPKGFDRGIQKRIYENTPTDPAYLKQQDDQSDQVAKALANDPVMQKAQANWPAMTDAEKAATLKTVIAAQSKAMGIPAPEVVVDNGMKEAGQTIDGVYNPDDGKLHINMDKDAMASSLPGALSIAAHENTHHYQQDLVDRLNSGKLQENDPDYAQAKLFAVNDAPHGYIGPGEGLASYKQQPVERDAWNNGARTARKIMNGLGAPP